MEEEDLGRRAVASKRHLSVVLVLGVFIIFFAVLYFIFKVPAFFGPGYTVYERIWGGLLLLAELFIAFHSTTFLFNFLKSSSRYNAVKDTFFVGYDRPFVSCLICSYNEPRETLEETVRSVVDLNYKEKEVILLDDSKKEFREMAKALGRKFNIKVIQRDSREGYKAGAINNGLNYVKGKYIAVFDADQKPYPNFLEDLVPLMEDNEKLALIQTPQSYTDRENPVSRAAGDNQLMFYGCICEGKNIGNAMFCCGTNFIMRTDAIKGINGFDETILTEDIATTIELHKKGWKTMYYDVIYAKGLAPATLRDYFKQQYRWGHGGMGTLKKLFATWVKGPFALKFHQWWEYFISCSYYLTGITNIIFVITPMLFIFFGLRPLISDPWTYVIAYIPYFLFSWGIFIYAMRGRQASMRDMMLAKALTLLTSSVYASATTKSFFGIKSKFMVTQKKGQVLLRIRDVIPQLILLFFSALAAVVGFIWAWETGSIVIWISVAFALYHTILLSYIFRFNRAFKSTEEKEYFLPTKPQVVKKG